MLRLQAKPYSRPLWLDGWNFLKCLSPWVNSIGFSEAGAANRKDSYPPRHHGEPHILAGQIRQSARYFMPAHSSGCKNQIDRRSWPFSIPPIGTVSVGSPWQFGERIIFGETSSRLKPRPSMLICYRRLMPKNLTNYCSERAHRMAI